MRVLRVCVSALLISSCASVRHGVPVPPGAPCSVDPTLVGTWRDARFTQLGPAWVRVSFAADCTFAMRIQGLWFRVTETGRYDADSRLIVFHRRTGETRWPYVIADERLLLAEADEVHAYRR